MGKDFFLSTCERPVGAGRPNVGLTSLFQFQGKSSAKILDVLSGFHILRPNMNHSALKGGL